MWGTLFFQQGVLLRMIGRCIAKIMVVAAVVGGGGCFAQQINGIAHIQAGAKGTTMSLAGVASGWKDSWKESAPNTFFLTDATGSVRVCIWPDTLAEAAPPVAEALKRKNTPVRFIGEIAVFRDRPEVHIKDGGSVSLVAPAGVPGAGAAQAATSATLPVATLVPVTR